MSVSEPPRRVEPQLLFGVSLLAGLALAWPALSGAMHGDVDITVAGARLLAAIAFVWTCTYLITGLFTSFSMAADRRARTEAAAEAEGPRRRAADLPALAGPSGELDGAPPTD